MTKLNTEYTDGFHTILCGDVIENLKKIPSESVDLVFADPPYNIGKDFDGIKDRYDEDQYLSWMKLWINELNRVTKKSGSLYLMNSTQNFAPMDLICRELFTVLSRIVWSYDSSGVQAKNYFGSGWEPILYLVKDRKNYTFNADKILVEAKTGSQRKLINYRKTPPEPYKTEKVPNNVWDFHRVRYLMEEYENHPTQKPTALLKRIILASSNEGDTVLDPFSGSFTTSYVAKSLNRKSIGIELNPEYVKIGLRRLDLSSEFSDEELKKEKKRKTSNKSKKDHIDQDLLF